jgi:hypothetical protein
MDNLDWTELMKYLDRIAATKNSNSSFYYDRPTGRWMSSVDFFSSKRAYLRKERIRKIYA